MNTKLFLLFLIVGDFFSCKKKEKIVEVKKEVIVYQKPVYKWKQVKWFLDGKMPSSVKNKALVDKLFVFLEC
jgi:hypothetical protein